MNMSLECNTESDESCNSMTKQVTNFHIPVLGEGRDKGAEGDGARVGEEARDFADAADILVAVRRRESEVAAEAVVAADVVSVEAVAENSLGEEEKWRSFNSSSLMNNDTY